MLISNYNYKMKSNETNFVWHYISDFLKSLFSFKKKYIFLALNNYNENLISS